MKLRGGAGDAVELAVTPTPLPSSWASACDEDPAGFCELGTGIGNGDSTKRQLLSSSVRTKEELSGIHAEVTVPFAEREWRRKRISRHRLVDCDLLHPRAGERERQRTGGAGVLQRTQRQKEEKDKRSARAWLVAARNTSEECTRTRERSDVPARNGNEKKHRDNWREGERQQVYHKRST